MSGTGPEDVRLCIVTAEAAAQNALGAFQAHLERTRIDRALLVDRQLSVGLSHPLIVVFARAARAVGAARSTLHAAQADIPEGGLARLLHHGTVHELDVLTQRFVRLEHQLIEEGLLGIVYPGSRLAISTWRDVLTEAES